jgi:hypothetical protein
MGDEPMFVYGLISARLLYFDGMFRFGPVHSGTVVWASISLLLCAVPVSSKNDLPLASCPASL